MNEVTEITWSQLETLMDDRVMFQVDIVVTGLRELNLLLERVNDGITEIHFLGLTSKEEVTNKD